MIKEINNSDQLLDYVVAIIPARGGSKRLPKKNIYPVWGKPMIVWPILAGKNSKYIHDIFVSSDSNSILDIATKNECNVIKRPKYLSDDKTFKMEVIKHATKKIEKIKRPSIVISMQANSPEIKSADIDKAIEHLIKYNLWEVISLDKNFNQNGALRVMTYQTVFQNNLSVYIGAIKTTITDIHTLTDVKKIDSNNIV